MYRTYSCLIVLSLLLACQKKDDPTPTEENKQPGEISGRVKHYDYEGVGDTLSLHTTTVLIEPLHKITVSDSLGDYKFADIPSGIYDLSFIRTETGLNKKTGIVLEAGSSLHIDASVHDMASWYISNMTINDSVLNGELQLMVNLIVPAINKQLYAEIYFGKKELIDPLKHETFVTTKPIILPHNQSFSCWAIPYTWLKANGYNVGEICFIKVFPTNPNAGYTDKSNNKWICTGTGRPYSTFTVALP